MLTRLSDFALGSASPATMSWFYRRTPRAVAHAAALHRFRQLIRYVGGHSPFYKRAFADRGIHPADVRVPADLGDFYTTPDDLAADPESFLCRTPNIVFESSGTSGTNKRVFYSESELAHVGKTFAAGMRMLGLRPDDRVANCFDFDIWIPGLTCHYGLMATGNFCQAFGKVDPAEVYRRLKVGRFTVVLGEPTWLIRLTQLAEADGGGTLRFLIGGAEEMPAAAVPWMQKVWNGAVVKMNYSTVETGTAIGFQPCMNHDGYHLDTMDFLPEVLEPDADGYGELAYSTLSRRTMPLVRYRSRDVTRLDLTPCPCGLPAPRLAKIRGRRDEMVVASGGNLYPKLFENLLRPVPGLTHDWQVVFRLDGIREILDLTVETDRTDTAQLEADVHHAGTELYPDLMKNLALGIFDLRVHPVAPGSLRTGRKLRRLVDRRHFEPPAGEP